jgi:hypothetical protein
MRKRWLATLGLVVSMQSELVAAQLLEVEPSASQRVELGLHARATQASARAERAAWLTLAFPLEALAAPRVAQAPAPPPPAPEPPIEAQPTSMSLAQLRALSAFLRQAKAVTLGVAGASAERRRLDSLAARSRASAALPELRLRAQRDTDQALRWVPTNDDPYRVTQADGAGTTLEASLTFQLDRLVFSREELQVERLRAEASAERLKLEARVAEALWGLFRAQQLACVAGVEEQGRAAQLAALVEHFSALDDLTAGWFAERAPAFSRAVWGFPEAILGACAAPGPPAAATSTKAVASLTESE